MKYKRVLSIAGSDPSGGAGIQADLKTFTSLGVYGSAVITCLTIQNTEYFKDIVFINHDFIRKQIEAVLEDIKPSFIKIGMLGSADAAKAAGLSVRGYFTVCDPVMLSKYGGTLLKKNALGFLEKYVISNSSILTPNYDELKILSHSAGGDPVEAGRSILDKYENLKALVIKGGHINERGQTISDILLLRKGRRINRYDYSHRRINTINTHGTGCTLSSAIAAFLARGSDIERSVSLASDYVHSLIELAALNKIGKGRGPLPHHMHHID